jgi:hypothetical protein
LPIQFRTDGFGIFAPGLEISSERMKQHHPFRLGRSRSRISEGGQQEKNNSCSRANATDVKPSGHAVRRSGEITKRVVLTGLRVESQQVVSNGQSAGIRACDRGRDNCRHGSDEQMFGEKWLF